jgi:hypothetical protein
MPSLTRQAMRHRRFRNSYSSTTEQIACAGEDRAAGSCLYAHAFAHLDRSPPQSHALRIGNVQLSA